MSKVLIGMLQNAHAGEIAAYHAYEGHWKSLKDHKERKEIRKIQEEEMEHIELIEEFLKDLNSKPLFFLDLIFSFIGRVLSVMCYFTGYRLPMYVAKKIEQIGVENYNKMALEAREHGHHAMYLFLCDMSEVEQQHEKYFKGKY
jgi:demethoxyubiquinone hydroxylase (CLK1/Coq7/Cat5 family)